jgi:selenide,water dikinase
MLRLNRRAAELAADLDVHAATDITGFGLLGHAAEVARHSGVGLRITAGALPLLPGALGYAEAGVAPGGLERNRRHLEDAGFVQYAAAVEEARRRLLFDPQTSGGLLFALPAAAADELLRRCEAAGEPCVQVGEVVAGAGITIV